MKQARIKRWMLMVMPGVLLVGLGGCLGPNPGFFISSSATNATIMNLVNQFWNGLLP